VCALILASLWLESPAAHVSFVAPLRFNRSISDASATQLPRVGLACAAEGLSTFLFVLCVTVACPPHLRCCGCLSRYTLRATGATAPPDSKAKAAGLCVRWPIRSILVSRAVPCRATVSEPAAPLDLDGPVPSVPRCGSAAAHPVRSFTMSNTHSKDHSEFDGDERSSAIAL
jgi:hypothetical protein